MLLLCIVTLSGMAGRQPHTVKRSGSSPSSSFVSRNAVSISESSPSSTIPPGKLSHTINILVGISKILFKNIQSIPTKLGIDPRHVCSWFSINFRTTSFVARGWHKQVKVTVWSSWYPQGNKDSACVRTRHLLLYSPPLIMYSKFFW